MRNSGPCVSALERGLIDPLPLLSASYEAKDIQKAMECCLIPRDHEGSNPLLRSKAQLSKAEPS